MRGNCKRVVIALCFSLCLTGVCTGCSKGNNSSKAENTMQAEESTENMEKQDQDETVEEVIEDVKTYEVDPDEKAEFSFDGEQGVESGE